MQAGATDMPRDTAAPEPRRPSPPAEPATARALWPTFMRRTLPEDMLQRESLPRPGC
jgi:hypothetical protein